MKLSREGSLKILASILAMIVAVLLTMLLFEEVVTFHCFISSPMSSPIRPPGNKRFGAGISPAPSFFKTVLMPEISRRHVWGLKAPAGATCIEAQLITVRHT